MFSVHTIDREWRLYSPIMFSPFVSISMYKLLTDRTAMILFISRKGHIGGEINQWQSATCTSTAAAIWLLCAAGY